MNRPLPIPPAVFDWQAQRIQELQAEVAGFASERAEHERLRRENARLREALIREETSHTATVREAAHLREALERIAEFTPTLDSINEPNTQIAVAAKTIARTVLALAHDMAGVGS